MQRKVINFQCRKLLDGFCRKCKIDFLLFVFNRGERWSLTDTVISTLNTPVQQAVDEIFKSNTAWSQNNHYSISQFMMSRDTLWGVHFRVVKSNDKKYSFLTEFLSLNDSQPAGVEVNLLRGENGEISIQDERQLDSLFFERDMPIADAYHVQKSLTSIYEAIRVARPNSSTLHVYFINSRKEDISLGKNNLVLISENALDDSILAQASLATVGSYAPFLLSEAQLASLKSAIGSIMSRNGSHNIGSHVLAALSHNVGTMPDDRMLYRYIQHRMDYIATVTTEFPTWTQPTMLVGELMRDFFSQRHLLDHIAESEGLSAWEFQNPDLTDKDVRRQHEKIKLRIRHKMGDLFEDIVIYDKKDDDKEADIEIGEIKNLEKHDVALAIPGGIIGNHAFYTILENVIRNAAKHGWSKLPPTERRQTNLEVTIDYEDCGEYVEFTIWDNMSNADGTGDSPSAKTLLKRQEDRVTQPFIDEEGRLRRENWGMAEIKISAGYLTGREIGAIGGLDQRGDTSDKQEEEEDWIVKPCSVSDRKPNGSSVNRLGYCFKVEKPCDVVFFLDTSLEEQKEIWYLVMGRLPEFRASGIKFLTWDEWKKVLESGGKFTDKKQFAARYVVLPEFDEAEKQGPWPFRVLTWKKPYACKDLVGEVSLTDIRKYLDGTNNARALRETVETAWVRHLMNESACKPEPPLPEIWLSLVINTEAGGSGSGRGLITNADVLGFVFTHGLRTAIETFFETNHGLLSDDTVIALWALHALPPPKHKLIFGENDKVNASIAWELLARLQALENGAFKEPRIDNSEKRLHLQERFPHVVNKLDANWWEQLKDVRDYLECAYGHPAKESSWEGNATFPTWNGRFEDAEATCYRFQDGDMPHHEIARFVRHLENAFCEADVFLRKYEERITTLPSGFSSSGSREGTGDFSPRRICGIECRSQSMPSKNTKEAMFYRHFRPESESLPDTMIYQEPLSGTQSYFNAIAGMEQNRNGQGDDDVWVAKMAECALLKICVADERAAKFLRDHPTVRNTYGVENILVLDDKWVEEHLAVQDHAAGDSRSSDQEGPFHDKTTGLYQPKRLPFTALLRAVCDYVGSLRELPKDTPPVSWIVKRIGEWEKTGQGVVYAGCRTEVSKDFDILIMHQGLIDKWLGETSHSKAHVAVFLGILKLYVKYVVITTGRGTPANIPPGARVLPFPTLESSLFRMYPEKLVLVDTIMNILPVGEQTT